MSNPTSSGLEGTIVAETAISDVDGERGRLVIAGSDVEQLAAAGDYERAVQQVLSAGGARVSEVKLGAARLAAWEMLARVGDALDTTDAMDALRTGLGHLRPTGDDTADAIAALGAAPVLVAAWNRKRMGAPPIGPDPTLDHATDYLRMSTGSAPSREAATALDVYLVTVIDHAMSASTFTARVIASTGSDLISAIVGAVGALKGRSQLRRARDGTRG